MISMSYVPRRLNSDAYIFTYKPKGLTPTPIFLRINLRLRTHIFRFLYIYFPVYNTPPNKALQQYLHNMTDTPQIEQLPQDIEQNKTETPSIKETPSIDDISISPDNSKFAWKESLTDKFQENETENANRVQSFTGYHMQFKTWKKE